MDVGTSDGSIHINPERTDRRTIAPPAPSGEKAPLHTGDVSQPTLAMFKRIAPKTVEDIFDYLEEHADAVRVSADVFEKTSEMPSAKKDIKQKDVISSHAHSEQMPSSKTPDTLPGDPGESSGAANSSIASRGKVPPLERPTTADSPAQVSAIV